MVTILGLFWYLPAAQAGSGSIIGDEYSTYIEEAVTGDFNADGTLDVVVCSRYTDQRSEPADDCIPEDPDDASDPTDPVSEGSDPDDPECDGVVEKVDVGAVHIFTSGVGHETPISAADGVIYGKAEGDHFGRSCANAGDFNGDGLDDLVVGAYLNNDGGTYAGAVYVIFGSPDILDIVNVEDARVLTILGANSSDYLGTAVASVGDSDGDGNGDIIIAAPGTTTGGSAYLVYGGSSTRTLDLGLNVGSTGSFSLILDPRYVEYYGEDRRDLTASAVAGIGDVNGDGRPDLAVGASQNDDADYDAGKVYILLGGSRPSVSRLSLDRRAAAQLTGEASYDNAGEAIAGAGDVNGDGYADVVIGVPDNDEGGTHAGAAYVWYGSADPADGSLADTQKFINGSDYGYGYAGSAVAGVGDFDGDGLDDLLVGAAHDDDGGSAWLVFGSDAYDSTSMTLATGTAGIQKFTNPSSGDQFGHFVGPAGDLDGDGTTYVIIGAPYNDDGGTSAGKVHIRTQRGMTR